MSRKQPLLQQALSAALFIAVLTMLGWLSTRYKIEADPLIVHDALSIGLPVVATDVGCVPELIADAGAGVSVEAEAYLDAASRAVAELAALKPAERRANRIRASDDYRRLQERRKSELRAFLSQV